MEDFFAGTAPVVTQTKKEFAPIPTGNYEVEVKSAVVEKSNSGDRVSITYRILSGDHANMRLWSNFYLIKKDGTSNVVAKELLKKAMTTLGASTEGVSKIEDLAPKLALLEGTKCEVKAILKSYAGNDGLPKTKHDVYVNHVIDASVTTSAAPKVDLSEDLPAF